MSSNLFSSKGNINRLEVSLDHLLVFPPSHFTSSKAFKAKVMGLQDGGIITS